MMQLKEEFRRYLNENYSNLKYHQQMISEAFSIYTYPLGMTIEEILSSEEGISKYKDKLIKLFEERGRKAPKQQAGVYCRNIRFLYEFVNGNTEVANTQYVKNQFRNTEKMIDRNIAKPTPNLIGEYLMKWTELENYKNQESALDKLFLNTYKENKKLDDILVKVATLNDFYSTQIFSVFPVAKHILELDIDKRLEREDMTLVNDIANVRINVNKSKNFYSFATKYCSHHKPLAYPIYDSFVNKLLLYYNKIYNFSDFNGNDLKDYTKFKHIMCQFRTYFRLEQFNLKEIDKFLWQYGKEKFPKKY